MPAGLEALFGVRAEHRDRCRDRFPRERRIVIVPTGIEVLDGTLAKWTCHDVGWQLSQIPVVVPCVLEVLETDDCRVEECDHQIARSEGQSEVRPALKILPRSIRGRTEA